MIKTWKVAALAVFAAVSIASPALAQGYGHAHSRNHSGYAAFGAVPRTYGSQYSPSINGGGSSGYNWAVENDQ
jgi:hypothetical protein